MNHSGILPIHWILMTGPVIGSLSHCHLTKTSNCHSTYTSLSASNYAHSANIQGCYALVKTLKKDIFRP